MDEIVLETGIPKLVDPGGKICNIYNSMLGDDALFVSSHGDKDKKWLRVEQGDYLKFSSMVYIMQDSNGQVILPVYATTIA